ncbi:MAG: hypothetical protein EKK52_06565 [Burkholderiales bacterium]|nr:MAG: hypothetical protein EKK52_06565 [Burkholderiales bacterium]
MDLAPWLAVAGAGALHGLNPCTGWALAAAGAGQDRRQAWRALLPLALGHAASVGVVAGLVALGLLAMQHLPWLAAAGLVALLAARCMRRPAPRRWAGLALWSFSVASAQGSGLMLLPALLPLCLSGSPAREITASGSLALALAAVALHLAAMLATTALAARAAVQVLAWCARRWPQRARLRPACRPARAAGR